MLHAEKDRIAYINADIRIALKLKESKTEVGIIDYDKIKSC
jgi:hypothetical protein